MMKKPKRLTTTIPPKSGPCSQGLNISYKTGKVITLEKTTNGRNRQGTSKL